MNKNIRDTMNILFESTNKNKKKEQAKVCLNPVNWKKFVDSFNDGSLVNKYPSYKASDFVSKTLFPEICKVIKENNLEAIHEKYDDYNWYCIFGNTNDNVKKQFDIDNIIKNTDWNHQYGSRGIGENYYYIYMNNNMIIGRCCLSNGNARWILLADQNIFDDMNISITR